MTTYQQVRDVVAWMRKAHQQLRDALEHPRSQAGDARTRLMLEALRNEEQQLQLLLARFGAQGEEQLLNTWLQFIPDEELRATLASIEFTPEMPADDVVSKKSEFDQALVALLRQLSEETSTPRVETFFRDLLSHVESRASQQAWSVREYQGSEQPPELDS